MKGKQRKSLNRALLMGQMRPEKAKRTLRELLSFSHDIRLRGAIVLMAYSQRPEIVEEFATPIIFGRELWPKTRFLHAAFSPEALAEVLVDPVFTRHLYLQALLYAVLNRRFQTQIELFPELQPSLELSFQQV